MVEQKGQKDVNLSIGDYQYTKFLGQGSFGTVYKGKHKQTGEDVAVKCMDMAKIQDPYMIESLKKEIHVMKILKSPNIVKMYDAIFTKQTTYIILELCPEGDLDKFIEKHGGHLDEKLGIEVLTELMNGFKELVSHNYIHRDIKPANSLIKDGVHKVADFGFATEADISGKAKIRECCGSPLFMAPQLLENQPYTAKSDIWSIGVEFFMMIFGDTPWPCRDINSYLNNVKRQPLRFPYNKQVSQETKDFIQRCLTINEDKRIGWKEVFSHAIFHSKLTPLAPQVQLNTDCVSILTKLQEKVKQYHIDIFKFFSEQQNQNKGQNLNKDAFYKLLQQLNPSITRYEADLVFSQIDKDHSQQISFEEFSSVFNQYDFRDVNDFGGKIVSDLKEIIRNNNLKLMDIFNNFDKDKGGQLDLNEFGLLLRVIAPALKDREIQQVYKKFDVNNDGNISFSEFQQQLSDGIKGQGFSVDPHLEKGKTIIRRLQKIIYEHKLNLKDIFQNFDKSKDGQLDQNEFTQMILVVDKTAHQEDVVTVFKLFDRSNSGGIDFKEFYQYLNSKV